MGESKLRYQNWQFLDISQELSVLYRNLGSPKGSVSPCRKSQISQEKQGIPEVEHAQWVLSRALGMPDTYAEYARHGRAREGVPRDRYMVGTLPTLVPTMYSSPLFPSVQQFQQESDKRV